jgi:hypothetical protein
MTYVVCDVKKVSHNRSLYPTHFTVDWVNPKTDLDWCGVSRPDQPDQPSELISNHKAVVLKLFTAE